MYKTILIPIDLAHAEQGKAMIDTARRLAGDHARIVLVNVIEDVPTFVAAELPGGILEQREDTARQELEAIARSAKLGAEVEVRRGQAANAIMAVAEEKGADLIIVASHRPGLADYFLGSTASRVVRHAQCSVLVAR